MKHLLYISIVLLSVSGLYSQIEDIARLPTQNTADTFFESAPVIISENELTIFYVNAAKDTIFSTTSRDGGRNWELPNALVDVGLDLFQLYFHLTALRSSSGRILFAWANKSEGMLIFSDDNGTTWTQPQPIVSIGNPAFQKRVGSLNLSQLDDGKILLSFNDNSKREIYFIQSSDDGVTWSEEATEVYSPQSFKVNGLTVVSSTGENLLAVFEHNPASSFGIYKLISTDNGLTWSDTIRIINTELNETRPKIVKRSDGSLLLTYLRAESTQIADFNQDDIYYMISSDGGETWQEEKRFTKYAGNDDFINISHLNGKTFISFVSQRFTNNFQISYGVLEETVETFTPPYLLDTQVSYNSLMPPTQFTLRATIIDDDQVGNVDLEMEDMLISDNLYDDGMHDDLEANDNVWADVFPFVYPRNIDTYEINVNNISLPFTNDGALADVDGGLNIPAKITSSDFNGSEITANASIDLGYLGGMGKFEEGTFLFSGGFWLSGYLNGELWANAVASASLVEDYLPGVAGGDPENSLNNIYVIYKNDPPFGSSWIKWKDAVSLGAEFYDGDGDGNYNPVDKNRNGTWDPNEDMPALIGDITSWCVYNDGVPDSLRRWESGPQGIEVRQTMFASSLPGLENVIFIKYSVLNTGSVANEMDSVYFGKYADADLGDHSDDVVGCDTLLSSGYTYNNTPDFIYGENCPAFFTTFLQGPLVLTGETSDTATLNYGTLIGSNGIPGSKNRDISSHIFHIGGDPNLNEPDRIEQARNYMLGKDRLGFIPDPCSFLYCEVRGGVNCSEVDPYFWASGDPVTDVGWINRMNQDHRNLVSTGPFRLEKDKPQEIIIAYVMGRGTDYLNSITVARENVRRAIAEYESNFASMTYTAPPPTNPVTDYVLYHNYPNPFNPTTTIRYELPQDGVVTIKIFDILGQEVEIILNEFKTADRYEIEFNSIGLASGVYIYRMKVNDFIESKKMLLLR